MNSRELKARLRADLGSSWSEDLWQLLDDLGIVADAALTEDYAQLRAQAWRMVRVPRAVQGDPPRRSATGPNADRLRAISALLADSARHDEDVIALRAQVGDLVSWPEVEQWVRRQAASEGAATRWIELPAPEAWSPGAPLPWNPSYAFRWRTLRYVTPADNSPRAVRTRHGGLLEALADLSNRLGDRYGWEPAQGATWTLTGVVPAYASLEATWHISNRMDVTTRLVLTIDPATPAADVADFYRRSRRGRRYKRVGPKHARLAELLMELAGDPWRDRLRVWNVRYPHERYEQMSNFRRDAVVATRRLLGP